MAFLPTKQMRNTWDSVFVGFANTAGYTSAINTLRKLQNQSVMKMATSTITKHRRIPNAGRRPTFKRIASRMVDEATQLVHATLQRRAEASTL